MLSLLYSRSTISSQGCWKATKTATILCDSRSTLKTIQNSKKRSGQQLIHAILQATTQVRVGEIELRLQWMPGYCDNPGNDAEDRLAKDAAYSGKTHTFCPPLSREGARLHGNIPNHCEQQWKHYSSVENVPILWLIMSLMLFLISTLSFGSVTGTEINGVILLWCVIGSLGWNMC